MSYTKVYFGLKFIDGVRAMEAVWREQDEKNVERTLFTYNYNFPDATFFTKSQIGEDCFRKALNNMGVEYVEGNKPQVEKVPKPN